MTKQQTQSKAMVKSILNLKTMTQVKLAAAIGASLPTVKTWTIKNPKPVSNQFMARIYWLTGATIAPDGVFRDSIGDTAGSRKKTKMVKRPFCEETFKRWRERFSDEQRAATLADGWGVILHRIFLAALPSNATQQSKLPMVIASLKEWSEIALKDFGLMSRYEEIRDKAIFGGQVNKPKVKPAKTPRR
jgi:hypothetical protein